jgi:hypothetical protein
MACVTSVILDPGHLDTPDCNPKTLFGPPKGIPKRESEDALLDSIAFPAVLKLGEEIGSWEPK